jgi:hypothetical protein
MSRSTGEIGHQMVEEFMQNSVSISKVECFVIVSEIYFWFNLRLIIHLMFSESACSGRIYQAI